jgi:hypothetical protein
MNSYENGYSGSKVLQKFIGKGIFLPAKTININECFEEFYYLKQASPIFILTYLFGALAIKNYFTAFDLSILLIAGLTKLSTSVVAEGQTIGFRGSYPARGPEVTQA